MNRNVPDKQSGFVLLAVVLAITVLAAIAFALSHQGASQVNTAAGELQSDQLRYVSEAGLHHAKWQLAQNSSCTTYANLPATPFGLHSYSATIAPTSGSPVSVAAQGTLVNGAQHTLQSDQVSVYEASSVLTLQPDTTAGEDTHIYEWKSAWNYGTAATLRVENIIAGDWSNALLKFDLSSIPASAKIISATLVLNQSSPAAGGGDFSIHRVTNPWVEGVMNGGQGSPNWTNRDIGVTWATLGGDYDPAAVTTINIPAGLLPHQWEVAALVQSWVSGDSLNFGMAIVPASFGSDAFFHSSDASNAALRPKLTITYACECGVSGSSSTLVLQPPAATGKDTYLLNGSKSNNNTGSGKQLWVSDSGMTLHRALVEFDLPDLPAGVTVQSATLDLYDGGPDAVGAGTQIGIHRVTRDWVEGSGVQTGTNPADGASWDAYNGVNAWTSPGGDYDPLTIDSSPIPDVAARWHQFDATPLVSGWVTGTYPNHGVLVKAISGDVTKIHLVSSDDVNPELHPKLTIHYSCPCGTVCSGGGGGAAGNLLLIVGDATTLSTKDAGYKTLIESWGYTVSVIDDGASQADYDTAMAAADVVYASGSALGANMLDKATYTTKGVVNEVPGKIDNFGFSSVKTSTANFEAFSSTDALHYITQPFNGNPVTVFTSVLTNPVPGGTLAPDLQNVGEVTGMVALGTLDLGATRYDSIPSQGRRAHLPFAAAETNDLTADGKTILQRTIEWAAASALPPVGPPPPGYLDQFNNGTCDAADYTGSDGALDWSPWAWTEINESDGSCAGQIQVAEDSAIPDPGSFRLRVTGTSVRAYRMADLSSFTNPRLSFNYRLENYPTDDFFRIRVTVDDLANPDSVVWTEIGRYTGPFDHTEYQTASFDLKSFIDVDTVFQLEFNGVDSSRTSYFDNFYIHEYTGVVFEEFTDGTLSGASNALVVAKPTGTVTGDLLIAAVAVDGKKTNSLAAPAGWNVINVGEEPVDAGEVTLGVWWKVADASETADYTFTWSANESAYGMVMHFTGHDPVNPINVSAVAGGASNSPGSPAVTTTVPNTMILRLGGFDDDDINIGNPGLPGHIAIAMGKSSSGNGTASGGAGYTMQEAAGDSGISTFTLTKAEEYRTVTIAIAPAP